MPKIITIISTESAEVFHFAKELQEKGNTVLLTDLNSGCFLTSFIFGSGGISSGTALKEEINIKNAVSSCFECQPKEIEASKCIELKEYGVFFLPGSPQITEYENLLSLAQDLKDYAYSLRNLPGAINELLEKTAKKYNANYVVVNIGFSHNSINQNVLAISDFFLVISSDTFFSSMRLESLSKILPKWMKWLKLFIQNQKNTSITYKLPEKTLRYVGMAINIVFGDGERLKKLKYIQDSRFIPSLIDSGIIKDGDCPLFEKFENLSPELGGKLVEAFLNISEDEVDKKKKGENFLLEVGRPWIVNQYGGSYIFFPLNTSKYTDIRDSDGEKNPPVFCLKLDEGKAEKWMEANFPSVGYEKHDV